MFTTTDYSTDDDYTAALRSKNVETVFVVEQKANGGLCTIIMNVIWVLLSWPTALMWAGYGIGCCCTIIGIPFGKFNTIIAISFDISSVVIPLYDV